MVVVGGALLFTAKSDVHSLPWLLVFILHSMAREKDRIPRSKQYRFKEKCITQREGEDQQNKRFLVLFLFCFVYFVFIKKKKLTHKSLG